MGISYSNPLLSDAIDLLHCHECRGQTVETESDIVCQQCGLIQERKYNFEDIFTINQHFVLIQGKYWKYRQWEKALIKEARVFCFRLQLPADYIPIITNLFIKTKRLYRREFWRRGYLLGAVILLYTRSKKFILPFKQFCLILADYYQYRFFKPGQLFQKITFLSPILHITYQRLSLADYASYFSTSIQTDFLETNQTFDKMLFQDFYNYWSIFFETTWSKPYSAYTVGASITILFMREYNIISAVKKVCQYFMIDQQYLVLFRKWLRSYKKNLRYDFA